MDEIGVPGDVVEVDREFARHRLLSARIAVYADEFNLKKYRELIKSGSMDRSGPSSAYVMPTVKRLVNEVIILTMNSKNPWTITRDHIRIAFRLAGFSVPNECITLPQTPITGPNIEEYEGKDFVVILTINDREKVNVRIMLHHDGQPVRLDWNRKPRYALLPEEQGELLESMPCKEAKQDDELV